MSVLGFGLGCGRMLKLASPAAAPPDFPTGALAIWDFEDTLASSPGAYTLTASGGNSYVTGKVNTKALQLTAGNTASVTTNDFNFNANPMTCSFWVKRTLAATNPQFSYTGGGSIAWQFGATTSVVIQAGDGGYSATDAYDIPADTWTYVCIRFSAATGLTVNVNARAAVTDATCTALGDYSGDFVLAGDGDVQWDQIAIDDRRWTDQEVADVYNSGSGLSS